MRTNGHNTYLVTPSEKFKEKLEELAPVLPGLSEAIDAVACTLASDPLRHAAAGPGDQERTVQSPPELAGAPVVAVVFTVWQGRKVTMERFIIVGDWQDPTL